MYFFTHMEIFGCNNLVSYKVKHTMDLQHFLLCCNRVGINSGPEDKDRGPGDPKETPRETLNPRIWILL